MNDFDDIANADGRSKSSRMLRTLICAVVIFLSGCAEADEPLPNGYRFVELSRGNGAIITSEGDFAVYPNVVQYEVSGTRVLGKRELATDNTDYSQAFAEGLGYFIFDTANGQLRQGLPQSEIGNFR